MADNLVRFVACDAAGYFMATHDANTLYFVTDEQRIYKGDIPYSGGIYETVESLPATPSRNTLYVVSGTGQVVYYDGTKLVTVVLPKSSSLGSDSDDAHLATAKSVVDYVASKISDLDVGKLSGQVATNKNDIATLVSQMTIVQGDGEGSIAKALSDAKLYADGVADAAKTEAVSAAKTETTSQVSAAKTELEGEISKKADSATMLAGYGITDAYTKTETDTAISSAVANAHHLKREIVDSLPAIADANEDTIYMVKKSSGAVGEGTNQSYTEYMLINGTFEIIGDSAVDLTDYATKIVAEGYVTTAIQGLDVTDAAVSGQYVSAVSEVDGKVSVTRTVLPTYALTTGSTNGSVSFNGTDVSVKGLGSAAYADSSAYATSAQGSNADSAYAALTWGTI